MEHIKMIHCDSPTSEAVPDIPISEAVPDIPIDQIIQPLIQALDTMIDTTNPNQVPNQNPLNQMLTQLPNQNPLNQMLPQMNTSFIPSNESRRRAIDPPKSTMFSAIPFKSKDSPKKRIEIPVTDFIPKRKPEAFRLNPLTEPSKELDNVSEASDITDINKWSSDVENVLYCISHNAGLMAEHHKYGYYVLQNRLIWFKIPLIIFSSINSVFSVGLTAYLEQSIVSTTNCLISLLCAIISSTELYLSIQKRSDQEVVSYRSFYLLSLKINAVLKLEREHRNIEGREFMTNCLNEYSSLFESSQVNGLGKSDKLVDLDDETLNIMVSRK